MEWLKNKKFGAVLQFCTSVAGAVALGYALLVPVVKPLAAEAFVEMLKEQGVDPEVFKELKEQSDDVTEDVDLLKKKMNEMKSTLDIQTNQNRRIEDLVNRLLDLQLKRRADFTPSPPGTGPHNLNPLGVP